MISRVGGFVETARLEWAGVGCTTAAGGRSNELTLLGRLESLMAPRFLRQMLK